MKKLMILGAGVYQLPLIKKAKELGYEAIVLSYDGNYPGFKAADKVYKIDTTDKEAVLRCAKEEGICGIVTTGTDVAVRTVGYVNDALGLSGIGYEAAKLLTDKMEMKRAFSGTVRTADFIIVKSFEEACEAAERIGYPVILKACDISGSRGVNRADDKESLRLAYDLAVEVTKRDYFVVEDFIDGKEIGVDGCVEGGSIKLCLPHEKFTIKAGNATIPSGHGFPLRESDSVISAVREQMERVAASTGMDNCMFNADMFIDADEKVWVIEAGARGGATGIPELIEMYTGIDYYREIINTAVGIPADLEIRKSDECMSGLIFAPKDAYVKNIDREKLASLQNSDVRISLDVEEGEHVSAPRNGADRIGQVLMYGGSETDLKYMLDFVRSCIEVE